MTTNIIPDQVFSGAIQLAAQPDYHGLTHCFLDLLEKCPGVDSVTAYEVYGNGSRKSGENAALCERLVRRFPLDFSAEEEEDKTDLLREIGDREDILVPSKPDNQGNYLRALISITHLPGPDRTLIVRGRFDHETLDVLSHWASLYRNLVELHDGKERDTLTKLLNRQSFDRRIIQVCEYYMSHPIANIIEQKSSWIAMLDIDHFKRVNDTFGHLYGDEVLLIFSRLLEQHFRYNDFLFRFGGEEFVVILNLVDQPNAVAIFERFRQLVSEYQFPTVGNVTISIGVAHIDSSIMPSTLLDRADKALYHAKSIGRNRVIVYENTPDLAIENADTEPDLF